MNIYKIITGIVNCMNYFIILFGQVMNYSDVFRELKSLCGYVSQIGKVQQWIHVVS